jgi:hypothetical protein
MGRMLTDRNSKLRIEAAQRQAIKDPSFTT